MMRSVYKVMKRPEDGVLAEYEKYQDALADIRMREGEDIRKDSFEPDTYYMLIERVEVAT